MRLRRVWVVALLGVSVLGSGRAGAAAAPVELSGVRTSGARSLVVSFVGAAPVTDPEDRCQRDYAASVRERGGTVTVVVRPVSRAVHRARGSELCSDLGYFRVVTVRLDRPLGTRTLVDAATGDPVPVFDGATRLRAGWLPEGWTRQGEGGGGCWSSDPVPCWHQTWGTPEAENATVCPAGTGFVQLAQAMGPPDPGAFGPDWSVVATPVTVRGVPAEMLVDSRGPGSVTVRWSEGEQSIVLYGGSSCAGAPAPASDVVLRIADGLRRRTLRP